MEFPIYRQQHTRDYQVQVKIASKTTSIYVSDFYSGNVSEIETDLGADAFADMVRYPMESSAAEFTAAYEAVQLKITNAVNTK